MIQALGCICLKVGPDPNKEVPAKEEYVTAATLARCITVWEEGGYCLSPHITTTPRPLWSSGQKNLTLVAMMSIILLLFHACTQQKQAKLVLFKAAASSGLFLPQQVCLHCGQHRPDQGHCLFFVFREIHHWDLRPPQTSLFS